MIYTYDGRGERCPVPLINLRLLLKKMTVGDKCIILISDLGSAKDIPKFLNKAGFNYHRNNIGNGIIELIVNSFANP